ncbi:MAG: hypothetical protein FD126_2987 [Elusimicrobia bacterium]|nr:MAG: hypothetical protein FD126_2987 [Elusimicrobiota bacterium]
MGTLALALAALASSAAAEQGSECSAPMYAEQMAAAVAEVSEKAPEAAEASLKRLENAPKKEEGLRGHPGLAALLSVRAKGAAIKRAVYCGGKGAHWVGVEAADGRVFRLPLGADGDPGGVDLARMEERRLGPQGPERGRVLSRDAQGVALASLMGSPAALVSASAFSLAAEGAFRDSLARVPSPVAVPARPFAEYCKGARCRSKKARVTIDTDGYIVDPAVRAIVSSKDYDRHYQPRTAMSYAGAEGPARYLDATRIPYVVKHRDSPWALGDLVLVEHQGRSVVAIVGDTGRRRRINEISHAAATALGIDPHGNTGGSPDPVTVTRLGNLRLRRPESEAQIFAALEAMQTWVGGDKAMAQGNSADFYGVRGGLK